MFKIRFRNLENGFTIIELVAVIVVLGICLAPFGVMFHHIMAKHARPEAQQVATSLAKLQIERVSSMRFSDISNEGPTVFTDFPNYTYEIIVSPVFGQPDTDEYKKVEVIVANDSIGVTVSLITIVTIKENVS